MSIEDNQPKPGDMVILERLPPGFLDDLPLQNQIAIRDMIENRLSSTRSLAGDALNLNSVTSLERPALRRAISYMSI
jgi:hypothetical protein